MRSGPASPWPTLEGKQAHTDQRGPVSMSTFRASTASCWPLSQHQLPACFVLSTTAKTPQGQGLGLVPCPVSRAWSTEHVSEAREPCTVLLQKDLLVLPLAQPVTS